VQSSAEPESKSREEERPRAAGYKRNAEKASLREDPQESESDEEVGPMLPGQKGRSRGGRMGPSIPRLEDLELKKGMICRNSACRPS
jgi:hypothetical protein